MGLDRRCLAAPDVESMEVCGPHMLVSRGPKLLCDEEDFAPLDRFDVKGEGGWISLVFVTFSLSG